MTPEQKHLADRIIKLLALANSTTFAAEAQSARAIADQLMRVHNINLGPGKPSQETIECHEYIPFAKKMRWEGIIAGALSDLCSCIIFFDDETLDSYDLVGTISNLDVCEYMLREINRQRIRAWLKYKGENGADSFQSILLWFRTSTQEENFHSHFTSGNGY
jgi:hypothetical protein